MMAAPAPQGYAYDNQSVHAVEHHDALSGLLDNQTRQLIEGLVDLPGSRCLEVAAGGGSIAVWLAEEVGPTGSVLATDLKPERIPNHPELEVRQHDITTDAPPGQYDLVHARLLLNHLPERRTALRHMVEALAPGGVLLTEDFWPTMGEDLVVRAKDTATAALVGRYQQLHMQILASHGNDRNWSRRAILSFIDEGLEEVRIAIHGSSWRGGSPGCRLLRAGMGQLHDQVIALGMTDEELARVSEALMDPDLILYGYLTYATSGRRPAG
jgi:SAM-dependent methyltransferase